MHDMPIYPTGRRVCRRCRIDKPIDSFPLQGQGEYRRKDCKPCWADKQQQRQADRAALRAAWQARRAAQILGRLPPDEQTLARAYRAQTDARAALQYALRAGRLTRPKTCQECGAAHPRIEGHHLDYAARLEVIWLCRPCHLAWHRAMRAHAKAAKQSA